MVEEQFQQQDYLLPFNQCFSRFSVKKSPIAAILKFVGHFEFLRQGSFFLITYNNVIL